MNHRFLLLIVLSLIVPLAQAAPRIGLVLAGGGAKGAAHIGVLKVLEELHIPIHAIAGTSMGSLVGGAYAAGLTATELEQRVTQVDWDVLFDDDPPRPAWPMRRKEASLTPTWNFTVGVRDGQLQLPKGALAGQQVQLFFNDLVREVEMIDDFDALPIPFRAVATDLEHGTLAVFARGSLPMAMRASMAVPGIFAPVEWEQHLYVDGGLVRNVPVDVARAMGVDVLIVVTLGRSLLPRERLNDILGVTGQMIAILTEQNVDESLRQLDPQRDVLIEPQLGDIGSGDFARAADAIQTGIVAARRAAPQLARYRLSAAAYAAWRQAHARPAAAPLPVTKVSIVGLERVNAGIFADLQMTQRGQALDRARLAADLQALYGRGDFERLSYRLTPDGERGSTLVIDALEKRWGPGYLGFGLDLVSDNQGDSRLGLRSTYDQTWVNAWGAEWRNLLTLGNAPQMSSSFYQPLALDHPMFVAATLDYALQPTSVFIDDQRLARYDVNRSQLRLDVGTTLGASEWRLGVLAQQTATDLDTGGAVLTEESRTAIGPHGRLVYDTLDSAGAPRSGLRLTVDAFAPQQALGSTLDYRRAKLTATAAHSIGAHTLAARMTLGSGFGSELPYDEQFALGGFLHLSGYANEQFRGNDVAFAALSYYRQIASLPPPLGRGLYAGASLEMGWLSASPITLQSGINTEFTPAATRLGSSLFLGSDTWVGPAYLGIGFAESGAHTLYLLIGQP